MYVLDSLCAERGAEGSSYTGLGRNLMKEVEETKIDIYFVVSGDGMVVRSR